MTSTIISSKLNVPRKNGNEVPPPAEQPAVLPEHRQKTVEAGLATYQKVLAERDDLEVRLREANLKNGEMQVQLDALKSVVNMMESTYLSTKLEMENRVNQYQRERDDTVTRAVSLEAVLANCLVIIRNTIDEPQNDPAEKTD